MKSQKFVLFAFALSMSGFLSACATYRPILDENPKYLKVGQQTAEKEIDQCLSKADVYLKSHKSEQTKKEMGRSAAIGGMWGAGVGLFMGGNLSSTAVGAAVGAGSMAGSTYVHAKAEDQLTPDELKKTYVTNCLARMDYSIIGWK